MTYKHGIRENLDQFLQQLLQVFFVGLTIGMQRNVVPVLAESEFGVAAGSYTLLMAFVVSFGFVKGAMNFVSGRVSERVGRRKQAVQALHRALAAGVIEGKLHRPHSSQAPSPVAAPRALHRAAAE